MRSSAVAIVLLLLVCTAWNEGSAQTSSKAEALQATAGSALAFEVASVREVTPELRADDSNLDLDVSGYMRYSGGPVVATGRIVNYILFAYKIADASQYPLIDAQLPKWAQEKRYHLVARSPVIHPTKDQLRLMVREMLSERFQLKLHMEQRDEAVYELKLAKGRPGPGLKPHVGKAVCGAVSTETSSEKSKDAHPPYCGPMVWMNEGLTHLRIMDFSMEQMAGQLSPIGASFGGNEAIPVVDHTGLAGPWDLDVEFQRAKKRTAANDDPTQEFGMDFTQALGVQDGLVLSKTMAKVPFVVVDHVEPPSEN